MAFSDSGWGTANATIVDPEPIPFSDSAWGTANVTLEAPSEGPGDSAWGTANASLRPHSDSDWGRANATLPTPVAFPWWFVGGGPARFYALLDDDGGPPPPPPPPPGYRDYLLQPYNNVSIWNTPIGDNADEVPADLTQLLNSSGEVDVDPIRLCMDPTEEIHPITNGVILNHVTMPVLSAANSMPPGSTVRIPDSITHNSGWNGIFAGLNAVDQTKAWTGQALNRPTSADEPTMYRTGPNYPTGIRGLDDLKGPGRKGAHGGGQCGGIGGTLREWEYDLALTGEDQAIYHRLALNVYSTTCLSQFNNASRLGAGLAGAGWRWPAYRADAEMLTPGQGGYYGRNDGSHNGVVMGSLLALPEGYSLAGLTDPLLAAIGWTLLNFGCHIVDSVGVTPRAAFSVEQTRDSAWAARSNATFHTPLAGLLADLVLIDDCLPTSLGGAGSPRVPAPLPLAP